MTTKHTPGPWEVNTLVRCWDILKAGEERLVGLLAVVLSSEADALLIAAAPETAAERDRLKEVNAELLEALKTFPGFTDDATIGDDWLEKAWAATAKAEGRE
jgi:hypothetical protein